MGADEWRRCSGCKQPIGFAAPHWVCSVSTCRRPRTGFVFCSVECWDSHLPVVRHRDAWAEEAVSPTREEWARAQAGSDDAAPPRFMTPSTSRPESPVRPALVREPSRSPSMSDQADSKEVLVVVSKLKAYIRARASMNTSDAVAAVVSDRLRELCDAAIDKAKADGRKTVLDRDF